MRVVLFAATVAYLAFFTNALPNGCSWSNQMNLLGINGHNIAVVKKRSLTDCKNACENTAGCKSIDFRQRTQDCSLNRVNTDEVATVYSRDYVFMEIRCPENPIQGGGGDDGDCVWLGPTQQKAITGHNIIVHSHKNPAACKAACDAQPGCLSVDSRNDGSCSLNSKNTPEIRLDPANSYDYYEKQCKVKPSGCVWKPAIMNQALTGFNIRVDQGVGRDRCLATCASLPHCYSVDYNRQNGDCSLNGKTSEEIPLDRDNRYEFHELSCDGRIASCQCTGDPHCQGFDRGAVLHYMGSCSYTLFRDNCENGLPSGVPTTEVIADYRKNSPGSTVSYVRGVMVRIGNDIIRIFQGKTVTVNGVQIHGGPYQVSNTVEITFTFQNVYVTQKDGIRVKYDGVHAVYVSITADMAGKVCGICGDADGDGSNDWIVGPSDLCMDKYPGAAPGSVTRDLNVMGTSWTHSLDSDSTCATECPTPPVAPGCTTVSQPKAEEHCKILTDMSGPFGDCLSQMSPEQRKVHYENCIFDSCTLELFDTIVCTFGESLALECANEFNIVVQWRSNSFCPLECPSGMTYKTCTKPCNPTCSDPNADRCSIPDGVCEEGCFCEDGKVFDGEKCISKDSCGCLVPEQDVILAVGESFISDDCSETCSCDSPGAALNCRDTSCSGLEQCVVVEGVRTCVCEAPAITVDGTCRNPADACGLPKDLGVGSGSETRFFFNKEKCKCISFSYKGEAGNANNFESKNECETVCSAFEPPPECMEPVDAGNCADSTRKYYYNKDSNTCKKFNYSGCGGSGNRFDTKEACQTKCKRC